MTNIQQALAKASKQLDTQWADARLEAEILLGHVLDKNRAYLFAHPDELLLPTLLDQFESLIQQRKLGEPIAYLLGVREFWSLALKVNRWTLIPRHETERLVELALELMPAQEDIRVLDLGTGSGAIALALAKERPSWQIDACDASPEALEVAIENASNLGINTVQFYLSNWFSQLPAKRYHLIVSNPPYIDAQDPHLQVGDVRFEPQSALVSSKQGLADLQYIAEHSIDYLLPAGLLLLEHGFEQKFNIQSILNQLGYCKVESWQDLLGHDRVSGGWHPNHTA